ncbi:MAG: glutamate synthase central domain-containing protein, partial [Rhodospirillaceae bacterium]
EPWDGPAAMCASDGRWVLAYMDRNGLRPMRYTLTKDGLLIVGSETGMVRVPNADVEEKGRIGPGQMIAVDLKEGKFFHDQEIKDSLAAKHPYGEWMENTTHLDSIIKSSKTPKPVFAKEELVRRQAAYSLTMEDLELILHPMVVDAKEPIGSMGDDGPLAVLCENYRGLHHFFRQNFSQVTNPPIDSLRERRVMTLNTRLGNLGNILDEAPDQCELLQLQSPMLTTTQFNAMRKYMGDSAGMIDCTFDAHGDEDALKEAIARVQAESEEAVRAGKRHLVLSDENAGVNRAPIPMILA